jgi:sulfate transport system permease protein
MNTKTVIGRRAQQDPVWLRWSLTLFAFVVVGVLIVIPVVNIFTVALSEGAWGVLEEPAG